MVEAVEHADNDDATEIGSSMSSCLPLLVFHHNPADPDGQEDVDAGDDDDEEMLMFSLSKQTLHKNMGRHLLLPGGGSNSMCWNTPQGWILLIHDLGTVSSSACLLNPSTGNKLPLPDLGEEHQIPYDCNCVLSHKDPTHPGCVVVLFNDAAPDLWYCHTTAGDGGSWRHYWYDAGNHPSSYYYMPEEPPKGKARLRCRPRRRPKIRFNFVTSVQGKIYSTGSTTDLCSMDFSSCCSISTTKHPTCQNLSVVPALAIVPKGMNVGDHMLVESRDQLFLVTVGYIGFDLNTIGTVEVCRMDFSSTPAANCWRRVHDIGDAVFLLEAGTKMAASCSASPLGLKGNQILFMKNLAYDDADLCIFDLETNTKETIRVHNHQDLILWRKPFWIVPPS